jgi:hypothetical protein
VGAGGQSAAVAPEPHAGAVKRIALAAALGLAALALVEVALRLAGYSAPQLHQLDPDLGWSLRAHKRGWYAGEAGRTGFIINAAGFRDR